MQIVEIVADDHLIVAAETGVVADHQAVVVAAKDVHQGEIQEEDAIHLVEVGHLVRAAPGTDAVIVIKGIDEVVAIKDVVAIRDVVATKEAIAETKEMAAKAEIGALQVGVVLDAELVKDKSKNAMVSALVDVEALLAVVDRGKKRNAKDIKRKINSMISLKR